MASNIGYLPCFSRYHESKYPVANMYSKNYYITKLKELLSGFVDSKSPYDLSRLHAIGKEIQPIRPDSKESKRIIAEFSFEYQLYRIDYGDTPLRVIFGLSNEINKRHAFIFAFDINHLTFK